MVRLGFIICRRTWTFNLLSSWFYFFIIFLFLVLVSARAKWAYYNVQCTHILWCVLYGCTVGKIGVFS
ncbi:hypothetical protein ES288_A09G149200v1 [Gossypium darwinii]|uniref:Uncharacterized protein n=2 Tax=Gossypium TaxID=3633 RepID=A0A5D2P542_GOSTO|nr:hypothetical protein ES288_A09G149200v1 [Gossypium darwinii]TYI10484.1 hypothetical protein ES332_A09G144000v1 [Gossypium tomentosum]